jgi:hypothetical protein
MNQLFTKPIAYEDVIDFVKLICIKKDDHYFFDIGQYKRSKYFNNIAPFLKKIRECYRLSKQKYVDKATTFKGFLTVLRQILRLHHIKYVNETQYIHGGYMINYYFYLE